MNPQQKIKAVEFLSFQLKKKKKKKKRRRRRKQRRRKGRL